MQIYHIQCISYILCSLPKVLNIYVRQFNYFIIVIRFFDKNEKIVVIGYNINVIVTLGTKINII